MPPLIDDLAFYLAAVPAVLIYGIAKGGFAGGFGVAAVPLMALVVSPVQAAAILLPILCVMDLVAMWVYRGQWVWSELRLLIPASLIGIAIGTMLFGYLDADAIRLLLGVVALAFSLQFWWQRLGQKATGLAPFGPGMGVVAGGTAGFTSFIAHAGGPPLSMYLLRRELDRTAFVATATLFFTIVNYVKLVPYSWLGQFDTTNLATSLVLAPLAPVGIGMGKWLHDRVSDRFFFDFAYGALVVVGAKLIWDGVTGF